MIEVNLLPGQKRKAPGGGFKFKLPDFATLVAQVKDPWLIGAIAAWVVVGGGGTLLFLADLRTESAVSSQLEAARAEKRRYDAVIADKRKLERVRDTLLVEINVIRGIDAQRYVWPHAMDQIAKALPPYTWLTNVMALTAPPTTGPGGAPPTGAAAAAAAITEDTTGGPTVRLAISGRTVDIQAFTTFLRQLAASPWFTDVQASNSQTVMEADRPVTQFDIQLKYRVADSVYIHTVPLAQSLVR
ncbi:MAG TPA: PilN domain-containing protein [Gemmatimonadales bacterium]|nr:PilN domain-containing protein [Gemmatimonadales bacterium]